MQKEGEGNNAADARLLPAEERSFPRLSRASPSYLFCPLLLCAHGAPRQWDRLTAWRRHGSAGPPVCARVRAPAAWWTVITSILQ